MLNHTVSTYVKNGQPIYHIFASNELPVSERTIYNYFEKGYLDAKNIDLRRKVSYKKRYQHKTDKTILKRIKQGRTYEDYLEYIKLNPDASIVEMDTVISAGDSRKVLLTFHFVKYHFQLAYILESKEVINVTACINDLCNRIGLDNFQKMFEVILTDNGTEFSDPESIEFEPENGELRCKVFYCHPYASREKGHCEKNHEYIRYILPKGTVFDFLTQDMCDLMMSHINSTKRPSVKGTPYDFMALAFGKEVLDLLKIKKIDSKLVILLPTLLTK
jgi:IS30 family transposase